MCRVRDEAPTLGQGYYNMVLGQSHRTPHGAMIDEYRAVVEW
jgi:hypothetical protein